MAIPAPSGRLQIQGERQSGQDVRTQNVTAVSAIANIVKTSLGPVGLDKVCTAEAADRQADDVMDHFLRIQCLPRCWSMTLGT